MPLQAGQTSLYGHARSAPRSSPYAAQAAFTALAALHNQVCVECFQLLKCGIGTMKLRRAYPTSPSTLPLSLPLAGRPNLSANRYGSVLQEGLRPCPFFSPRMRATRSWCCHTKCVWVPPKYSKARAWPSRKASVVSAGNAMTKQSSECGRS